MTHPSIRTLASYAALAASLVATAGHAATKPEIRYHLARTDVAVSVTMTLASCPSEPGELPEIVTAWAVIPKGVPDPAWPVPVDVSSGFLAKRSNAFEFYPNGTLSSFNGSSAGQGGAVLVSVLKTIAAVAPLAGAAPGRGPGPSAVPSGNALYCRKGASDVLQALGQTKAEIRELENKVLLDSATTADLDLLERRRAKRVALTDALTLTGSVQFDDGDSTAWLRTVELPELLRDWFSADSGSGAPGVIAFDRRKIGGLDGYDIEISPADAAFSQTATASLPEWLEKAQRGLVYRRPIAAQVQVTDRACGSAPNCSETLELDGPLQIGQWGSVQVLPVGDAGLFGSREASATFDAYGTPLKLSYGSDSGGAEIGSAVEAAGTTATALADADIAALEREIKREELRQKLKDLRTADAGPVP